MSLVLYLTAEGTGGTRNSGKAFNPFDKAMEGAGR